MSPGTFLLILAAVIVVFAAFVIKSWFELSSTGRRKRRRKDRDR
ncbi:MAG: hypothetical protein WB783_03315 [Arenicellales bacterium]